jgi:hypothetical protein
LNLDINFCRCGYCKQFENTYISVASQLSKDKIVVSRIDIETNQAVGSRFGIRQLPSIYLLRDGNVYVYNGEMSSDELVNFVKSTYKSTEPLPYITSPLGPVGMLKGYLTRFGIALVNIQPYIIKTLDVSSPVAFCIVALLGIVGIFSVFFITIIAHMKYFKTD